MESRRDYLEKVKNYTYDQTLNELLANKGNVIDIKLEIKEINEEIKRKKQNISAEKRDNLFAIKVEIVQKKTQRKALKKSVEFPEYIINQKRQKLYSDIKDLKKQYEIEKYILSDELASAYERYNNAQSQDLKAKVKSEIEQIKARSLEETKKIDVEGISKLQAKKTELQQKLRDLNKSYFWQNRILRRHLYAINHYNNLAQEKKEIKDLDPDSNDYKEQKSQLLAKYTEKLGKSLKYQFNPLAYWLMLIVILLQIVYIIVFLGNMKTNYLEFPVLMINLVVTLLLFLSAMKVKVHNKMWTWFNFVFSGYLVIRILLVIPKIAHDYPEILDEYGEVAEKAVSYGELRVSLIVISAIMLGLTLISSIISIKRIKLREQYLG